MEIQKMIFKFQNYLWVQAGCSNNSLTAGTVETNFHRARFIRVGLYKRYRFKFASSQVLLRVCMHAELNVTAVLPPYVCGEQARV
jgi:hypothetical protein